MIVEADCIDDGAPTCRKLLPILSCLAVFILLAKATNAGQLESFTINVIDGVFEVRIVALFDAPAERVFSVITDYKHIYRINPSIIETRILSSPSIHVTRVLNRLEHCFAGFCFEMDLVEDVAEVGRMQLVVTAVPELSSLKSGITMWHVRSFGDERSRVQYRASLEPKFFIPPLIGSMILKSILKDEITTSFIRIECYAKNMTNKTRDMVLHLAERADDGNDCSS